MPRSALVEPHLIGRHHALLTEFRRAFKSGPPPLLALEGPRVLAEAIRSGLRLDKVWSGAGRYGASGVVLGRARILTWHRATLRFAPSLRPSQPPRPAPSRESLADLRGATRALPPGARANF
ncbi:MAG TPA: hypothetical protein VN690_09315 [Terriglobales bacterium]|nr:hypothetical protein [Terriglobales bacterium]